MTNIRKCTTQDVAGVVTILNKYLSFGLANDISVADTLAKCLTYVYIVDSEIKGYVCARKLSANDFVLTKEEKDSLYCIPDSYIITHLVVDDSCRKKGIGKELIKEVLNTIDTQYKIYALGWIKSDSNKWEAETIFKSLGFKPNLYINEYFAREGYYCDICKSTCSCSASIYSK